VTPAPRFLSADDVRTLHAIAIENQGGDPSIRDRALLESAIAMPAQQFAGEYLHPDIPAMAAAYAFHICMNHPFIDGNKRAGTAAMIAFLSDNGWTFDATADEAEPPIVQLAAGSTDKPAFTAWLRGHVHEKPKMELRDFFNGVDPAQFTQRFHGLLPAHTQVGRDEFLQRAREAASAIPLLRDLERQQREAQDAGDVAGWERITMLAVGLLTLHALAEDMGYQW
jgi:death-on-curing protein